MCYAENIVMHGWIKSSFDRNVSIRQQVDSILTEKSFVSSSFFVNNSYGFWEKFVGQIWTAEWDDKSEAEPMGITILPPWTRRANCSILMELVHVTVNVGQTAARISSRPTALTTDGGGCDGFPTSQPSQKWPQSHSYVLILQIYQNIFPPYLP